MEHEDESSKSQEKILLAELKKGDLKFVLHGEKLKGAFALVKMKGRGENAWLLIKKNDDEASKADVTKKAKSVKTDRTLIQIAEDEGGKIKKRTAAAKKKSPPVLLDENEPQPVKKNTLRKKVS
jgi:bifunctional non-homologous end joining protein LigD